MDPLFNVITKIGGIIASTFDLSPEGTTAFVGTVVGGAMVVIAMILAGVLLQRVLDVRPSRLLRDIYAYDKQAQHARCLVNPDIKAVACMVADALEDFTGQPHFYTHFIVLPGATKVTLNFSETRGTRDVRITVPVNIFDGCQSTQTVYVNAAVTHFITERGLEFVV